MGWERLYVTVNAAANAAITLEMACTGTTAANGSVLFSCPQLEVGSIPSRVNMLVNGDFSRISESSSSSGYYFPDYWEKKSGILSAKGSHVISDRAENAMPDSLSGNALSLYSRPSRDSVAFGQIIYNRGSKNDCFTIGGWVNAKSVAKIPDSSRKTAPCIAYRFYDSDTVAGSWKYLEFNREWVGWQYGCWAVVAPEDYTRLEIHVNYSRNAQTAKFTNIFVHRDQFGQSFAYDDKKNITSVTNLSETKSSMKYDSYDNLTSYVQPGGADTEKYVMTYGSTDAEKKKHLLRSSTTPMGVKQTFDYDAKGNQTLAATVGTIDGTEYSIKTKTEYTSDGNYPLKSYDARGNVVTKEMDTDGTLKSVTDPEGQKVEYGYDPSKRVKKVSTTTGGNTYINEYTYNNDRLETVKHNTTTETSDVIYTFGYDALGRKTTVKVGSQTLSTNVYSNDRNGILKEVQYGNEGKVSYEHDAYDRITGVKYDSEASPRYTYEYSANGQSSFMKDNHLGRVHQTEYDLAERPVQSTIRDTSDNLIYRTTLTYDGKNRLNTFAESLPEESHKTSYTYDKDNRTTAIQFNDATHKVAYGYDALGRVISRAVTNGSNTYTSSYTFENSNTTMYGSGATTPLVKKITQNGIEFEYAYDERGNIVSEKRGSMTTTYAYDALGQLTRVNDPHENKTWVYEYDFGGNIKCKKRYAYTTAATPATLESTINYIYGDSNWKDKLTTYNGQTITYDAIGNPLTDGTWTYVWQAGRQLKQMSKTGMLVEFKYNAEGLRVQKKVTEGNTITTTDYTLHGKLITHQKITTVSGTSTTTSHMHFFYDNASRPAMVKYNGVLYTYVHNLQGDIVGIVDASGNLVVEYKYDAWGRKISVSGSMATTLGKLNPFRYRGYVYDDEIGMYYLQNRYYFPNIVRFINADVMIGGVGNLISHSIFTYCVNNPIVCIDTNGKSTEWFMNAVSNDVLYNAYWRLPILTQVKHTGAGAIGALLVLNTHQDCICMAAEEFDIEKEMIEAVLFRELICVGADDILGDLRFKITGRDCSTGIGQIKAETAIAAEKTVYGVCNKSVSDMWRALQNGCTNIRYVAMNLKAIQMNNDLSIPSNVEANSYTDKFKVFARYNGERLNSNTKAYASAVNEYYRAFSSLM